VAILTECSFVKENIMTLHTKITTSSVLRLLPNLRTAGVPTTQAVVKAMFKTTPLLATRLYDDNIPTLDLINDAFTTT
jgi:hypothetical protein